MTSSRLNSSGTPTCSLDGDLEHRISHDCESVELECFRAAMRKLTCAVTIITARHEHQLAGLTATSVSSLSLHPPSLIVCVNKAASAHDLLLRAGRFCVNILAAGATDAADVFADKERSADRFTTVPWSPGRSGVPVLDQSVAHFECRLGRTMDGFSHTVLIGIVLAANTTEGGMPLLYESGRYGAFRTL